MYQIYLVCSSVSFLLFLSFTFPIEKVFSHCRDGLTRRCRKKKKKNGQTDRRKRLGRSSFRVSVFKSRRSCTEDLAMRRGATIRSATSVRLAILATQIRAARVRFADYFAMVRQVSRGSRYSVALRTA